MKPRRRAARRRRRTWIPTTRITGKRFWQWFFFFRLAEDEQFDELLAPTNLIRCEEEGHARVEAAVTNAPQS